VKRDLINISSIIYISDESNISKMVIEQESFDVIENKLRCMVKGVFLSLPDANEVLIYLLNKSALIY
jgi:hypothetical protein